MEKRNLTYLYRPKATLQERLYLSNEYVKTEYVTLCADDDFIFPSGLIKAINFLDRNIKYNATQGRIIRFKDYPNFSWRPDYEKWLKIDINYDDPYARQKKIDLAPQFMYAVMRTHVYKNIISIFEGVKSGSLNMNEYAFQYATLFSGSYKSIGALYGARIEHSKSRVHIEFDTWKESNELDYRQYKSNVLRLYKTKLDISTAENLERYVTSIFLQQLKNKAKKNSIKKSEAIKKIRKQAKNLQIFNKFRPVGSFSRLSWCFSLGMEIKSIYNQIQKFKNFLRQNQISQTFGIID